MINTKYSIDFTPLYDVAAMEKRFEQMAAKGWMIAKFSGAVKKYTKQQPQNLKFTLVYINETGNTAPLTDEQQEFMDMCEQSGWQHIVSSEKAHVFATDNPLAPPIETDPVVQVGNIYKSLKENMICWFFLRGLNIFQVYDNIEWFFANTENYIIMGGHLRLILPLLSVILFGSTALDIPLWYIQAKKKAREENIFLSSTPSSKVFKTLQMTIFIGGLVYGGYFLGIGMIAVVLALVWLIMAIIGILEKELKATGGTAFENRWMAGLFSLFIVIPMMFIVISTAEKLGIKSKVGGEHIVTGTYTDSRGAEYKLYRDEIPLRLEELTGVKYEKSSTFRETRTNLPGLSVKVYHDRPYGVDNKITLEDYLEYYVIEVKSDKLYNRLLNQYTNGEKAVWEKDREIWNANRAFRYKNFPSYMLFYDGLIIQFSMDTDPDRQMCGMVYEKLVAQNPA